MNIAICCIAYNRVDSLNRLLNSLSKAYYNESVTLIISIDKSNTDIVERYADAFEWKFGNKIVRKHEQNLGLRKHVLECGNLVNNYDAIIILEDDVTVAPSFYYYAKQCVEKYADDENIAGISLYSFPYNYQCRLPFIPLHSDSDVYLMKCAQSWGQIWMKKQWNTFIQWYEQNDEEFSDKPHLPHAICSWPKSSWLKYHTRYCIENNKYFIYPYTALSTNNSEVGTHVATKTTIFQALLLYGEKKVFNLNPTVKYDGFFENEELYNAVNLTEDQLCIDFYGQKRNRENKRYWLTTQHLQYKIVSSYDLSYKPYELNILCNYKGQELFLYDTQSHVPNNDRDKEDKRLKYFFPLTGEYIKALFLYKIKEKILKLFHHI